MAAASFSASRSLSAPHEVDLGDEHAPRDQLLGHARIATTSRSAGGKDDDVLAVAHVRGQVGDLVVRSVKVVDEAPKRKGFVAASAGNTRQLCHTK
jgi:hypothetical protein